MALLYIFPHLFYISGFMGDCGILFSVPAIGLLWGVVSVQTVEGVWPPQTGSGKREERINSLSSRGGLSCSLWGAPCTLPVRAGKYTGNNFSVLLGK